jgi:hypothetical protein
MALNCWTVLAPRGRGVLCHIPMHNPTRADIQDNEGVQSTECCGDRHEEVTRERGVGVVAHKSAPPLGRQTIARASGRRHVPPHRPWRYGDTKLEPQFGGDPLFAPRDIRSRHRGNQTLQLDRERRTPARL